MKPSSYALTWITCYRCRYRAFLVIAIAAAATWTVQEVWLSWRSPAGAGQCRVPSAAEEAGMQLPPTKGATTG